MIPEKENSAALSANKLLQDICQARLELLNHNREPVTLYLGMYEYLILKAYAQQSIEAGSSANLEFIGISPSNTPDYILGLEIVRVQRASHLKVTD